MPDTPQGFEYDTNLSKYTTGDSLLERLLNILGNFSQNPQTNASQSIYDTFLQRERSRQYLMEVQRNSATRNSMTQFFGINPNNPAIQAAGLLLGDPSGGYAQALKFATGSNPVLAQSQLYSGLTGATMGAFGRVGNVGAQETSQMMQAMNNVFYNQRTVSSDYIGKQTDQIVQQTQDYFAKHLDKMAVYGMKSPSDFTATSRFKYGLDNGFLNSIQSSINSVDKASNAKYSGDDQAIKDAKDKALKQISDDFIKKNVPDNLQGIVKQYKDKNGLINFQGLSTDLLNDPINDAYTRIKNLQNITAISGGPNYAISRGYSQEELNPLFMNAAKVQLLGRQSMTSAGVGFYKNAGGALDAFRPIAAAMGTDEISAMNNLLGTDSVDLTTSQGSSKVEKLGRDVAAVARVAGTSIKSLVGMIKTMQDLAAQNPELQYLGSSITQMVLDAHKQAVNINAVIDPGQSRQMGGVQGIANTQAAVALQEQTSTISKVIASAVFMAKAKGGDALSKVQQAIEVFGNTNQNPKNESDFYSTIAPIIGATQTSFHANNLRQTLTNPGLVTAAMGDEDARKAGLGFAKNNVLAQFRQAFENIGQGDKYQGAIDAFNKGGFDKVNGLVAYLGLVRTPLTNYFDSWTDPDGNHRQLLQQELYNNNPDVQARAEKTKTIVDQISSEDTLFSKLYSSKRASVIQRTLGDLMNGSDKDIPSMIESLRNNLTSPDMSDKLRADVSGKVDLLAGFIRKGDKKTWGDVAGLFSAFGGGKTFAGAKDKEALLRAAFSELGSGRNAMQIKNRLYTGDISGDTAGFLNENLGLLNDDTLSQIRKGEKSGFTGYLGSLLPQYSLDRAKKQTIDLDSSFIEKNLKNLPTNKLAQHILSRYNGNYAQFASDMQSGGIESSSKFVGPSQYNSKDIKDVQDMTSDLSSHINQYSDKEYGKAASDADETQTGLLQQIIKLIKDPNSISNSIDSLVTTLSRATSG